MNELTPFNERPAAWRDPLVWRYSLLLGLPVALFQAALNQGDHWWRHEIISADIVKSILSPVLSCTIAFLSAAISRSNRNAKNKAA